MRHRFRSQEGRTPGSGIGLGDPAWAKDRAQKIQSTQDQVRSSPRILTELMHPQEIFAMGGADLRQGSAALYMVRVRLERSAPLSTRPLAIAHPRVDDTQRIMHRRVGGPFPDDPVPGIRRLLVPVEGAQSRTQMGES